ncbi:hypothetical protein DWB61_13605 [Ancylomarina euxinus]|uniref:Transposase n=1 Tax=Ancylomarina euxinus TaxID=2283627 RepID=A0A425XYJ6_9BACT|nr:transposase [Ancylomarina euxinus]MCZ4695758.1 transposase [Ancylomarina euxinus]MUP16211.1 transposase [Ancylomarina euxinus]RRG20070.1 hypothetical protein DWB61_13605 [Ancylomarina euxinus]
MEKERRKFSREFKLNAVELSYSRANIKELAHELDVRPELIYRIGVGGFMISNFNTLEIILIMLYIACGSFF